MSRRISRELALQALFQIDFNAESVETALSCAEALYRDLEEKGRSTQVEAAQKEQLAKEEKVELEDIELEPVNEPVLVGANELQSSLEYADALLQGVLSNQAAIDEKISASSIDWKLTRMPATDRNLMRIATYEMFFAEEKIDYAIAINEAVELAKIYGTKDSARFVNGLLGKLTRKNG